MVAPEALAGPRAVQEKLPPQAAEVEVGAAQADQAEGAGSASSSCWSMASNRNAFAGARRAAEPQQRRRAVEPGFTAQRSAAGAGDRTAHYFSGGR